MNPARMIFEDAPAFIPVPADLQHRRVEAIFWPLDEEANVLNNGSQSELQAETLTPLTQLTAANVRFPLLPSLAEFRAGLPMQPISAGDFCRAMRDEDRY